MDAVDRHFRNLKASVMNIRIPPIPISSGDPWTVIERIKIKPFTRNNILYYYMPLQGLVSYSALSVNVMNPSLVTRLFPRSDVTNALLLSTFSGSALWLWRRPHISGTAPGRRFPWVFLGSSMHVLGSVLMWAIIRSAVGRRPFISTCLGLISGAALTYSAIDYFNYLDKDIEFVEDTTEENVPSDEDKYEADI